MREDQLLSVFEVLISAGNTILEVYNSTEFQEQKKLDNTPVTLADKRSSKIIDEGLNAIFPEIPIIDEENNIPEFDERKNWPVYFLVDPLDGTKEFIKRNGEFCINLALVEGSIPLQGWIYQPLEKRGWYCKRGEGIVEFDINRVFKRLPEPKVKSKTIRIVTSRSFFKPLEAKIIDDIQTTYPVEVIHRGSSLKQIDIVLGNVDMYLKAGPCSEWDTAPGQLMVEEFGGMVFRQDNFKAMTYNKPSMINPFFIMLNSSLKRPDFVQFIQGIIKKYR